MREREGQAGTTTHLRCAGRCRASFRLSCFFPSVFWTSWRAGASRHEVPAACWPGSRSFHFFHVSLFRSYRTLSIALRCFISFRFRFVFSCLFTSFHALFCLLCSALHPHVCFGIFLSFQVSSCCSCIVLFFFYIFCYCPARWRGAPRPARLRGAWRGNRPSGAGWWASPPRCDVTDCTPSRMSCCIFQSGRYSPFGCFFLAEHDVSAFAGVAGRCRGDPRRSHVALVSGMGLVVSVSHNIFYLLVFVGHFWKATRAPGHSSARAPRAAVVC